MIKIQEDILKSSSKNELVSAGAGSGKTTVMINKIANILINELVPVDSFLVVTFTVLATNEMKERLIKRVTEEMEKSSEKQTFLTLIDQIKTASIDTIDGFSSKTIKKYFYELNISPNIEIISDATRDYYLTRAMKKTIDEFDLDKINILLDLFGGNRRNLDNLKQLILNNYYNVINLQDYDQFLIDAKNEYVNSIKSEYIVNEYITNAATALMKNIQNCGVKMEKLNDLYVALSKLNKNLSLKTNLAELKNIIEPTFKPTEKKENDLAEIITSIKTFFAIKDDVFNNGIDENFEEKNEKISVYFNYFIEILTNFIKNYNLIKQNNNLIDFNDLNRLMLELLKKENVKNELRARYKYIFIDEYQDVNPLQDNLISALVSDDCKLFMVGDVKQSIYGFRGASPEWFLNKYKTYKNDKNAGEVYDMNVNFRSNPKILNFINFIFNKLMTVDIADIDYKSDCVIEPQRDDIIDDKVKIYLVNSKEENDTAAGVYSVKNDNYKLSGLTNSEKEAYIIADQIVRLIGSEFYDANLKQTRELTYKDIAILTHSEKDAASLTLVNILKKANIPLNLNNKLDVESEGIKLILSILKCATLTADDVDYLAAFMALTNLQYNDLILLRDKNFTLLENLQKSNNAEVKKGFAILEDIINNSYTKTNSELIRYILNHHNLRQHFMLKPNGVNSLNLIEAFLNKLSSVENNLSLNEFVEVVNSNVSRSSDFESMEGENCVTIQTIHKSKGLEYPVVFLYNSSKKFSYLRDKDDINFNSLIGLGVDYFDTSNRTKCYSLTKYAIKIKNKQKGYKEELRLLYVALTRAKNKLIITGQYSENYFKDNKLSKNCYTNLILSCFGGLVEGENDLNICSINFEDNVDVVDGVENQTRAVNTSYLNFEYKNKDKFNISVKNTVTGLNSSLSEKVKFTTKQWLNSNMQYNADEDKAIVGTHYHKALELLDYNKPYEKNTDFKDVDYKKIEKAHKNMQNLIKNAKNIKKEAEFMMYVPYNQLIESNICDKVLVQGVVDLIIEFEDHIDIVDYKFSALPVAVLKEKYAEQLKLYKQAVEMAYNLPVKNTFIYSINSGEIL